MLQQQYPQETREIPSSKAERDNVYVQVASADPEEGFGDCQAAAVLDFSEGNGVCEVAPVSHFVLVTSLQALNNGLTSTLMKPI
jgi:hypothetical protein